MTLLDPAEVFVNPAPSNKQGVNHMTKETPKMRPLPMLTLTAACISAAILGSNLFASSTGLTSHELDRLRGGNLQMGFCEESCTKANNYDDDCASGEGTCKGCSNGSTTTRYPAHAGECEPGGYEESEDETYDCGLIQDGTCVAVGQCHITVTTTDSCTDPPKIVSQ